MSNTRKKYTMLTAEQKEALYKDIKANKGVEFCMVKYNISRSTFYKFKRKAEMKKPKMTLEQELEIRRINSNVSELAELIMKYVRMIDAEEASMDIYKAKIKVFRECIESMDNIRHGIMAYELEADIRQEGGEPPPEFWDKVISRFTDDELKEMLFENNP